MLSAGHVIEATSFSEEVPPEKHSRKSCSSLRALSIPFLACSSVRRVLISLSVTYTQSTIRARSVANVKLNQDGAVNQEVRTGHSPVT